MAVTASVPKCTMALGKHFSAVQFPLQCIKLPDIERDDSPGIGNHYAVCEFAIASFFREIYTK